MLWVLHLSNGQHSFSNIAQRSGMKFVVIQQAMEALGD
jgi:aminopeptidase-like protein